MKICSKCKSELSLSEFDKDNSRKDGLKYNCKSCSFNIHKKSRSKKPEHYKNKTREYYELNKGQLKEYSSQWQKDNPKRRKSHYDKWINKQNDYHGNYQREKRKKDTQYRLKCNLRERLRKALKCNWKKGKTIELLGCLIEEYKLYLEEQFDDNMSWENYGEYWEIDHIIPLAKFDLTIKENQIKAFNYKNTRPLTKTNNRKRKKK